jgi:hypothetical protein
MRLLFSNADQRQYIENRLAFDFQLPGQIVDSNLAHPPFVSSDLSPLSLHINLTVSAYFPALPMEARNIYSFSSEGTSASTGSSV